MGGKVIGTAEKWEFMTAPPVEVYELPADTVPVPSTLTFQFELKDAKEDPTPELSDRLRHR
jgi:hypothetical protein